MTTPCQFMVSPRVVALLSTGCPNAIGRTVSLIVVYSFNRVFVAWSCTHVGKEPLKCVPFRGNFNSSASIVLITFIVWVITSITQCRPNTVFWNLGETVRYGWTVIYISVSDCLSLQTSATTRMALTKFRPGNKYDVSTNTLAFPSGFTICCYARASDYLKPSKRTARDVF